ncbi:hypothetical protein CFK40_07485 [Virgibacillus necropolis]|uniref:Uncharacterized protein n=1 Tax=Virgibacillus necropolis TaxID=163877 RepID=A0A221MB38_9BACI|nr:hypothetical protein CFK40_07485 [Virgibacillus necropolis]
MIIDERTVCRSVRRVKLLIAGIVLKKGYTVMFMIVHGGLLIVMEDNVYCPNNDKLFSIIVFLRVFLT